MKLNLTAAAAATAVLVPALLYFGYNVAADRADGDEEEEEDELAGAAVKTTRVRGHSGRRPSIPSRNREALQDAVVMCSRWEYMINDIRRLYRSGHIFEASDLYQTVSRAVTGFGGDKHVEEIVKEEINHLFRQFNTCLDTKYIVAVPQELALVRTLCDPAKLDTYWTFAHNEDGIVTYRSMNALSYKTAYPTFMVVGEIAGEISDLSALVTETDLLPDWLPYITRAERSAVAGAKGNASKRHQVLHATVEIKWPITGRDVLLIGYGDRCSTGAGVYYRSMNASQDDKQQSLLPVPDDCIRMQVNMAGVWMSPGEREGRVKVHLVFNMDPKVNTTYYRMVNFAIEHYSHRFIKMLSSQISRLSQQRTKNETSRLLDRIEHSGQRRKAAGR